MKSDQPPQQSPPMNITITITDPDATACIAAYFAELDARFPGGFDPGPPADPASYRAPNGLFLIARAAQAPIGCVALSIPDYEVKRLWVAPSARGHGLGPRLMTAIEDHARSLALPQLRLDTSRHLPGAVAMYRRLGWTETPRYNDNPFAHHWFAKSLAP
jgi:GNAT superfamily N-acetyltransferase